MASRCLNCNGILTRTDKICYSCGDKVPKWVSSVPAGRKSRGSSIISNIAFCASLALTAYSLVAENKPPLEVSLAASGGLFVVKLLIDWTSRMRARSAKA